MSMISELVDRLRVEAKSMGTYGTYYMATLLMRSADTIEMLSEKARESDEPQTDCNGCKFVGTYDTEFPCANCSRKTKDYYAKDEPQTEMTTEQIVNELLSIKQILDDGKMPKQRCGNCKHLTYRWNKTWCDIKCDNPHDMVCDKWERSE